MSSQINAMSPEMIAELEALRAENAKLKAEAVVKSTGNTIKITDKGAVSVYGLGRFPVTLYRSQWVKLLGMAEKLNAFFEANKAQLDAIDEKRTADKLADVKVA